jgi:3-oxoacyl-[acyl-carrier protein] reductase
MDLGLDGRVVLLAGASRGIGLAAARAFAGEGCRVALMARDKAGLAAAAGEVRQAVRGRGAAGPGTAAAEKDDSVLEAAGDATREEDAGRAVRATIERFGRIDVLVTLVGGSRGDPGIEAGGADWDAALDANLRSAVNLTRLVAPIMKESKSGAIVHVASIFGREWGGAASYNAAKAALISYSKSCARALAPHGVRVNSVAPGSTLFPGGSWDRRRRDDPEGIAEFVRRELPLGRFGRPEEVAAAILFLASKPASLVIGACLNVDGGQSRSLI